MDSLILCTNHSRRKCRLSNRRFSLPPQAQSVISCIVGRIPSPRSHSMADLKSSRLGSRFARCVIWCQATVVPGLECQLASGGILSGLDRQAGSEELDRARIDRSSKLTQRTASSKMFRTPLFLCLDGGLNQGDLWLPWISWFRYWLHVAAADG